MRKKQQRLVRIIAIVLAILLAGGAIISAFLIAALHKTGLIKKATA